MKMITPRNHVHISVPFLVLHLFDTQSPNAIAPPALSIRVIILPISPHTIISQPVSSSIITSVIVVLRLPIMSVGFTRISPTIEARNNASRILLVVNMYTIRNIAGTHATMVGFSGSTGGMIAARINDAAITASAIIIVRGP